MSKSQNKRLAIQRGDVAPDTNKPAFELFPNEKTLVEFGLCPMCGNKIEGFRDELSLKEYGISGLCQECQDLTFGK